MSESGDPALIGRTIAGKFRVEKFLGGGAMGAVYLARQTALEKDVAVKVMHRAVAVDPQFAARFHREAKAASRLDHPNSMRVIDFGEEPDGLLYIAMEYLKGRDLYKVIHEDWPLSNARIADVVMQALAAIAVAHDMGVIHRDLKPENIMVLKGTSDDGHATDVVKVCDFGIAKITEREGDDPAEPPKTAGQKLTTAGLVVGTPEYMSPEQARGEKLDARSDIYSLGIILYQLLTGRVPFTADTALAIVLKHLTDPPEPPQTIYADVHKGLEAVCLKAISKAREDRFQNARDMRAALRAALDGKVLAPPAPHEMNAPTLPLGPGMTTDPSLAPKAVVTSPAMTAPATTAPTVAGVPAITTGGTAITPQKKFPWAALVVAAIVIGGGGTVAAKYGLDHRTPASNHDKPDDPTAHPTTKPDAPVPTGPTTAKITPEPTDTTPAPTIDKNGKKIPPPTTKKNEKNGTVLATTAEPPTAGTTAPPPPTTAAPPTETTPPPPPPPTVTTPPPPPPPVAFDPATCRAVAGPVSASGSTNKGDLNANGVPQGWGSCARNLKERLGGPVSAKVVVRFSDSRQFRGATCEGCPPAAAACVTGSASKMSVTFRGGDVTGDPTFVIPLTFSCD